MIDQIEPAGEPAGQAGAVPSALPVKPKLTTHILVLVLIYIVLSIALPIVLLIGLRHWISFSVTELAVHSMLPLEFVQAFCVVLATWVVARLGNRSMADYGLPPRQALGPRFWEGALWGLAMLSTVVLLVHLLGDFQITGFALNELAAIKYALAWGAVFLFVGINEEGLFRGFLVFAIARRLGFWPAAVILSLLFAAAHLRNPGENGVGILQVFTIGMLLCLALRRTGSLWFPIGLHMAWDWAETFFYGTPDSGLLGVGHFFNSTITGPRWLSGGSAGPEGSVFSLLVILIACLLIHLRFPEAVYPDRPV
jgi:uncharacterized protein